MDSDAPIEPTPEPEPEPAPGPGPAPPKPKESWWATLRFFLILFVGALMIRAFLVAPFSIPSGSMLPTLMIGDYLFVSKWSYGYSRYSLPFGIFGFEGRVPDGLPARGDVAVFRYPGGQDEDFVKRVIGLPGDTVAVQGGVLILNGAPVRRERIADFAMPISPNSPCRGVAPGAARRIVDAAGRPACAYPRFRETLPGGRSYEVLDQVVNGQADNFEPMTVPTGYVFVMGDNRDDSLDSRFDVSEGGVGLLPIDNLLGAALVAFWSTDGSASWVKPWTWFSAARWDWMGGTY